MPPPDNSASRRCECVARVLVRAGIFVQQYFRFRDFAIFEVRDFRGPIRLLLLEIRWGMGEWSSRGRQAELGELSMLWVIATSPPIDLVGQGTGITAELCQTHLELFFFNQIPIPI